jgi:hypothetical protein
MAFEQGMLGSEKYPVLRRICEKEKSGGCQT